MESAAETNKGVSSNEDYSPAGRGSNKAVRVHFQQQKTNIQSSYALDVEKNRNILKTE